MRPPPRFTPPSTVGAWPWMRLASLLVLLAVLVVLIQRLQDPDVVQMFGSLFVREGQATAQPAKSAAKDDQPVVAPQKPAQPPEAAGKSGAPSDAAPQRKPEPEAPQRKPEPEVPLGPTDDDQEEADAAREEFEAVMDGTIEIRLGDMFAYQRVLQWVINQPGSLMRKRARTDLTFNDFMLSPEQHRGALVEVDLNARMIRKHFDPEVFPFPLYEVWGFAADSGAWLYDALVVDLPDDLKDLTRVRQKIRIVGYFFKLQGYYPARSKPGARPEKAPLFIGRVVWAQPGPAEASGGPWLWTWVILGVLGLWVAVRVGLLALRRRPRPRIVVRAGQRPGAMPIEDWFDHAATGTAPDDESLEEAPQPGPEGPDANGDGLDGHRRVVEN